MKYQSFWKSFPYALAVISVAWLSTQPAAYAARSPGNVPYQTTGKIDGFNVSQKQIIIGDRIYILSDKVAIQSDNRTVSKEKLKKGMRVGFNSTAGQNPPVINEIWILSK